MGIGEIKSIDIDVEEYTQVFVNFLKTFRDKNGEFKYRKRIRRMAIEKSTSLVIDFEDLLEYDMNLATELIERPRRVIEGASNAVKIVAETEIPDFIRERYTARFAGLQELVPLRKIRSRHINKLIAVEGIVTRITPIKYLIRKAVYVNKYNPADRIIIDTLGYPRTLTAINGGEELEKGLKIRKSDYELLLEECEFVEWQKIVLQEKPEELPPGQMPRSIEVVFLEDLVDSVRPGDRVVVTGILSLESERGAKRGKKSIYKTYIEANYVETKGKDVFEVEITPEDEETIKKLASRPDIKDLIIRSIAPSIHGYETIKKGIACLLFGGEPKILPDGLRVRGDIHILLVGDPGTAKSQLLRFVSSIAPRGVFTTGKGSTAAGLTAAVVREKTTGDFYLEAGALVLADGGIACIDEFDKMDPRDRVSIHEAMEQQTISIAKAGIVATLNARAAILAAANPAYGRYIPDRTVSENIDLPITIISRFDLIFVITDVPNEEKDEALARHVVRLHSGRLEKPYVDILPPELLKKYIVYARRYIHPKLTKEAEDKIVEFYVKMRKRSEDPNSPIAITPRQLEALIRLAEAIAKMRLSEWVTEEDAQEAIDLMLYFLQSVGLDLETKSIDIDIVMTGKPMSQRDKFIKLIELINKLAKESKDKSVKVKDVIERAEKEGLERAFVKKAIEHLKKEGELYEPRPGYIKKI